MVGAAKVRIHTLVLILAAFSGAVKAQPVSDPISEIRQMIASGSIEPAKDMLVGCSQAGDAQCQFELARWVEEGRLVQKDMVVAKQLYEMAYANGYEPAGKEILRITKEDESDHRIHRRTPLDPEENSSHGSVDGGGGDSKAEALDRGHFAIWKGPVEPMNNSVAAACGKNELVNLPTGHGRGERVNCGIVLVEAVPLIIQGGNLLIGIKYLSLSDRDYTISPDSVVVYQDGSVIEKLDKKRLVAGIRRGASTKGVLSKIASVIDAIGTGMSGGRTSFRSTYQGVDGDGNVSSGIVNGYFNDPDAHREAMAGVIERSEASSNDVRRKRAQATALENLYLEEDSISPGQERIFLLMVRLANMNSPVMVEFRIGHQAPVLKLTP